MRRVKGPSIVTIHIRPKTAVKRLKADVSRKGSRGEIFAYEKDVYVCPELRSRKIWAYIIEIINRTAPAACFVCWGLYERRVVMRWVTFFKSKRGNAGEERGFSQRICFLVNVKKVFKLPLPSVYANTFSRKREKKQSESLSDLTISRYFSLARSHGCLQAKRKLPSLVVVFSSVTANFSSECGNRCKFA